MSTDRPDEPLSSEEMLRRAHDELASPPPEPPGESLEPAPLEEPVRSSPGGRPATEREWTAPADAAPAPQPRGEVPIPEPAPDEWATPGPFGDGGEPPGRMASRPGIIGAFTGFGGLAILVVVGFFAFFSFVDHSKSVDRLEPGDCFDEPSDLVFTEVDPIDCGESHDYEVFAIVDIAPSGAVELDGLGLYPGNEAVYQGAVLGCVEEFETYVGATWEESAVWLNVFTPTEQGWEGGDRTGICVLYQGSQETVAKTTGSLRGSGR